jgi:hypothetical protein
MEFPRRAITSHYVVPFLAHIPYVAKHTTTSDTSSIACISKHKTMGVKDSHYFMYQLDSNTYVATCYTPLSMSCKDKHTSASSSLLTLTIENELHNPCIAQGREKQLSCHRVDIGHSFTIDHITTSC